MYKKRRKGRGIDHTWEIVKYRGNMAIYSRCKCGFRHSCYRNGDRDKGEAWTVFEPRYLYNYCPHCGAKKKYYTEGIKRLDEMWL